MRPERFALAVLVFLALYAVWSLHSRFGDGRCRLAGYRQGGLVCTERPPLVIPANPDDLDRI